MKALRYILPIIITLGIHLPGQAQDLPGVCPGQTTARYAVTGNIGSTFQWDIPENIDVVYQSAYGDTIEIDWSTATVGSYQFSVSELAEHGCLGAPSFGNVTIASNQKVFSQEEVDICVGQSYDVIPSNYSNVVWHDGSTEIPYVASSTEKVTVQVKTGGECDLFDTLNVYSHALPNPDLDTNFRLCDETEVLLDPGFFTTYEWSTGDITDQIIFTPQNYDSTLWVRVSNQWGCINYDTLTVYACNVDVLFENIPNVFNPKAGSGNTPSGNTQWIIEGLETYPDAKIEIFDRWGRLVFSTNEASSDFWDGTYKGNDLPADSYYYVIDLGVDNLENRRIAGSVSIIY